MRVGSVHRSVARSSLRSPASRSSSGCHAGSPRPTRSPLPGRIPQPPRNHPLLVWIVFDELSYDQAFEHRARDLNLPNFDALRAQSTLFTDTQPAGYHTVKIIPSLLTGKIVDGIRYNFHNHLWVRHEDDQVGAHRRRQTVFADAENAGWRTAAVGWYNPYCAIYADAIQNCYWTYGMRLDPALVLQLTHLFAEP